MIPSFRSNLPNPTAPLFDCHVHLGDSDTGEHYYPPLMGDEYVALMEQAGIARACAFPPLRTDGYRAANAKLREWAATTGGRVLPLARLGGRDLPLTSRQLWQLRRKLSMRVRGRAADVAQPDELTGFAGVKLLPHLDGMPSDAEFAVIAERELPVLIHAGNYSEPRWIERAVLPRLRGPLLMAHLGAFPCSEHLLRDAVDVARRHERVYLDTSGVWTAEFVRYAAQHVPEKIVFGSDAPLAHPLVAWRHVASIVHDDGLLERIGTRAHDLFDGRLVERSNAR